MIYGGLDSFEIKMIKKFQILKGPLKVDNPITSKIIKYRMLAIIF